MEAQALAPALTTGISFSGLRFQTLTLKPAFSKRRVMGLPIKPIPMKPRVGFVSDIINDLLIRLAKILNLKSLW
jgi:hypothetical protein